MRSRRKALLVAGLSSYLLTATASTGAQTITATVRGTVADEQGGVLPGVSITVRHLDTNTARTVVTTNLGQYYLPSLPAGPYEIRTALEGFAAGQRQVELTVGADITVDFALAMSSLAEAVTVAGRTSDVDLARATVGRTINKALVDALPTANRDFVSLAQLSPGVSSGVGSNGPSLAINAQRGYQNNVFVDGASNQWQYYGKQASTFSQDWIQEFQVMTNSYAAEFGQASGGILNVITRSGSNQYHGRAYAYYRDNAFDSPPFAGSFENDDVDEPVFLAKDEVPDYTQRRWGGTFGGPLVKDRLFFFAGYEDLLRESNDTLAIGDYWRGRGYDTVEPISTTDHPFLVKMDANLTDRHRLSVRYDRTVNTDVNTVLTSPAAITSHEARQAFGGPVWNLVGNLTSTLGSASFNEFRAYYMSLMPPMTCNASGTGGRANLELGPPGTYAWQWYPSLIGGCPPSGLEGEENLGFSDHLTLARGRHQVKVGAQAVRNRMVIDLNNFHDGAWVFEQDAAFDKADPATYPFFFGGVTGRLDFTSPAWVFSLFAQDTWQVSDSVTLTLGLRYDVDQGITAGNEFVDAKNEQIVATLGGTPPLVKTRTDYDNLSPRLAVVWTPTESKRTAVRGAYGHFYDQNRGNFNAIYIVNTLIAEANYEVNCYLPGSNPFWGAGEDEGLSACKGFLASNWPYFPDFSKTPTGHQTIWGLDPDLQVARTIQFSGGVSHQFANDLVLSADVVHARGSGLMYLETNYTLLSPYELEIVDPRFSSTEEMTNTGWTHYTALQAHARYRRSPLDVGVAYTLSKADSNITTASIYTSTPTNPFDLDQDEGPDDTDQRHNLVLNASYLFPYDFQLAGIVVWRSARPWTVHTNENPEGYVFPPLPEGKNSRRGDSEETVDLRVSKTFRFGQRASATIFWEMFNTFNWTNFTAYEGLMESPNFGFPTAAGDMRRQQLGFRLDF